MTKSQTAKVRATALLMAGLLCLLAKASNAQTAVQADNFPQRALFEGYTQSAPYKGYLVRAFNMIEPAPLRATCPALSLIETNGLSIISMPTFATANGQTVIDSGAWIATATFDRCGAKVKRRALLQAIPGENLLKPTPLLPGDFHGDLTLERDTVRIVIPAIMVAAKCSDLRSGYVIDIVAKGERTPSSWQERWTSQACGTVHYTDVSYRRESGQTTITAGPVAVP